MKLSHSDNQRVCHIPNCERPAIVKVSGYDSHPLFCYHHSVGKIEGSGVSCFVDGCSIRAGFSLRGDKIRLCCEHRDPEIHIGSCYLRCHFPNCNKSRRAHRGKFCSDHISGKLPVKYVEAVLAWNQPIPARDLRPHPTSKRVNSPTSEDEDSSDDGDLSPRSSGSGEPMQHSALKSKEQSARQLMEDGDLIKLLFQRLANQEFSSSFIAAFDKSKYELRKLDK